jgi:ABC-type Mn2+/Zn2+ transport system ATPase subunit
MTALLSVRELSAGYGSQPVLEGLSFEVHPGERIGVLGPNGGGKTTLFKALLGMLPLLAGHFESAGRFGYVPQTERSRLDYPVTALDVALMGALARVAWWRPLGAAERRSAQAALAQVGLEDRPGELFGELSGGQRQRVLVARALVQDGPVLLLDEPFTGVDRSSAELLDRLLDSLAAEGRGVLIATHDLEQTRGWDQVLCLNRRQIAFGPPEQVLTRAVLEETYGGEIVQLPPENGEPVGILPPHHH